MNRHSSPYASAGYLINEHLEKRRGLKSLAFDTTGKKKKKGGAPDKSTYATVCKTLQHLSILNSILNANNKSLRKKIDFDNIRNKGLLYVMLYELLFGKYKSIRGGGKLKRLICKCEKELRLLAEEFGSNATVNGGVQFPRYIRVNTLQSSTKDMVEQLKEDLAVKLNEKSNKSNADNQDTGNTTAQIYVDAHVPDLLVLPPTASSWLHRDYEPVKSGKIILQDKSSCFSALVMAQGLGVVGKDSKAAEEEKPFDYIDACAAPGNKTSHLAALINSSLPNVVSSKKKKKKNTNTNATSTIFAFERDGKRHTILQERMNQLVPTISEGSNKVAVEPIHGDFLRSDPTDPKFANVKAIMLDPSCSGSGIVNSPDRWMEESTGNGDNKKDEKRIQSLSNFQLVALKHSMQFPNVDRIVYSTCSVHDEENEIVVSKALSEIEKPDDESEEWVLMPPVCLQHWKRRGKEGIGGLSKDQADCLIRCDGLDGDETNGFFVTFLVRRRLLNAQKERKEIEDVGISIYNGEFVDMCKQQSNVTSYTAIDESTSNKESSKPAQSKAKKQQPEKTTTTSATTNKATENKKSAKKREKKLAWKRKQALLKTERLKKKEAAASKTDSAKTSTS